MEYSARCWCRSFSFYFLMLLILGLIGCGGEPKKEINPAEARYADVEKAMTDLKYEKALSVTGDVISKFGDSEYAGKSRVLRIILLAGVEDGYRTLAEAYLKGMEKSKQGGPLRATAFDFYRKEKSSALGFYESVDYFLKNSADTQKYVLDCKFPSRDIVNNRFLDLVLRGNVIEPDRRAQVEEDEVRNGVIRMLTHFLGAGEDRAKARKALESGSAELDHTVFFITVSEVLLNSQKLFARSVLNEPDKYQVFFQRAAESYNLVEKLLKAKPDKDLQKAADKVKSDIEALKKKGLKVK
jgi:hypothetical protein